MLIFFNLRGGTGVPTGVDIVVNLIGSFTTFFITSNFSLASAEPFTSGVIVFNFSSNFSLSALAFFFSLNSLSEATFSLSDKANFSSLREVFSFLTSGLAATESADGKSSASFL